MKQSRPALGPTVNRLAELSLLDGWTQASLSRRLRISAKHMNLVWNSKTEPDITLLEDWARLIGCSIRINIELDEKSRTK